MTRKKTAAPDPLERWEVVRVAAFTQVHYQTARNRMLAGVYGEPHYEPSTRKLTVLASKVRASVPERASA